MAKSANQKIRLLRLCDLLTEHTDERHGVTMEEILSYLEGYGIKAERKTIYDDIAVLKEYGMNILMWKEPTARYGLVERTFELPELKLLVDAVQSSKFITKNKSEKLIKKLERFTSCHEAKQLQRQVIVDNRAKTNNEKIYYAVDCIHDAINRNKKITFQYYQWTVDKKKELRHGGEAYLVSPFALTWSENNYYLIAFNEEQREIRHYRVDKMQNVTVTSEPRNGLDRFKECDMATYSLRTFGMYGGERETVVLRCANSLAGVIIDRFGKDVSITKEETHFLTTVSVYNSPVFLSWVLQFGDNMEIISPQNVREDLVKLLNTVLPQYS